MYQLKNGKLPDSFNTLNFFMATDGAQTRQSQLANCSRYRTTYTSQMPFHKFPRIWNELDTKFHDIESLNIFKKKVHSHFLNQYSTSIKCFNTRCTQCFPTEYTQSKNNK
jgi:hypothetical protein